MPFTERKAFAANTPLPAAHRVSQACRSPQEFTRERDVNVHVNWSGAVEFPFTACDLAFLHGAATMWMPFDGMTDLRMAGFSRIVSRQRARDEGSQERTGGEQAPGAQSIE